MKRFDFSKLAGGGSPKAMDDTEDEQIMDPPAEDEEAAAPEEDEQAEAPEGQAMDEEQETAAAAFHRGRRVERARCAAIFAEAGAHNVTLAASLAFNSSIAVDEARDALAAAPKGSRLSAAMAGQGATPPQAGGSADDTPEARARGILARAGKLKKEG